MQRPKLSVSFSGSRPPKLSVSTAINHLVRFGLISVDTDSLESFVRSHYPFWIIHNFASATAPSAETLRRVKRRLIHLHGLNNLWLSSNFTSSDSTSDSDAETVISGSSASERRRLGREGRRIPDGGRWSDPALALDAAVYLPLLSTASVCPLSNSFPSSLYLVEPLAFSLSPRYLATSAIFYPYTLTHHLPLYLTPRYLYIYIYLSPLTQFLSLLSHTHYLSLYISLAS